MRLRAYPYEAVSTSTANVDCGVSAGSISGAKFCSGLLAALSLLSRPGAAKPSPACGAALLPPLTGARPPPGPPPCSGAAVLGALEPAEHPARTIAVVRRATAP